VDDIVTTMRRVRRRAGVPHATAYGYRHSYATEALSSGVPDAQVAALLGHRGTGMLHRHYSHLTSRAQLLREAAGKVRGDVAGSGPT
jgi:integrase